MASHIRNALYIFKVWLKTVWRPVIKEMAKKDLSNVNTDVRKRRVPRVMFIAEGWYQIFRISSHSCRSFLCPYLVEVYVLIVSGSSDLTLRNQWKAHVTDGTICVCLSVKSCCQGCLQGICNELQRMESWDCRTPQSQTAIYKKKNWIKEQLHGESEGKDGGRWYFICLLETLLTPITA